MSRPSVVGDVLMLRYTTPTTSSGCSRKMRDPPTPFGAGMIQRVGLHLPPAWLIIDPQPIDVAAKEHGVHVDLGCSDVGKRPSVRGVWSGDTLGSHRANPPAVMQTPPD